MTNGAQGVPGKDGHTPVITIQNGNWFVDGVDTGVAATGIKGETGNGIASIKKTCIDGLVDTYTITYTDGTTTFTVTNGATWESLGVVATGADGKDGGSILPIVISCISLAGMVIMFGIMMADRKKGAYAGRH